MLLDVYWPEREDVATQDWAHWPYSTTYFDFESIMIYASSYESGKGMGYTLTRKPAWIKANGDNTFWEGGNPNPLLASISAGDQERIRELYPPLEQENPSNPAPAPPVKARGAPNDTSNANGSTEPPPPWNAVRVVIPGALTTTVRPAPTYATEDIQKAIEDSLSCTGCWSDVVGSYTASPGT